jgi:hypothetical protein
VSSRRAFEPDAAGIMARTKVLRSVELRTVVGTKAGKVVYTVAFAVAGTDVELERSFRRCWPGLQSGSIGLAFGAAASIADAC